MRALVLVGFASLALAACNPATQDEPNTNSNVTVSANENVNPSAPNCGITSNTAIDEKLLLSAETAYNIPAQAFVGFDKQIPANIRASVAPKLVQAYEYLKMARLAYNAGDGCSLNKYTALVKNLSNTVQGELPAKMVKTTPNQ